MRRLIGVAVLGAAVCAAGVVVAQQAAAPGITRTPMQKDDFPAGHETHLMTITVGAGGVVGRHTHPGIEMGYVMEGEATLNIEGKGEVVLKPGSSYAVPAGAIHSAKAIGSTPVKIIGTFVVEKGKPLATPAP